jgi:hypothetical protein
MRRGNVFSLFVLAVLLGLGIVTPARAGVTEDLAAFKTAASELKACMVSITNEATAKSKLSTLDAAITKYNNASTTLDTSLGSLDRSTEANGRLYQSTQTEKQAAADTLTTEQVRMLAAPPIAAVVAAKLATIRQ